ncbi:MAG: class I adenylate-forming enzyme family protein [Verrucomicrobiota bacterium]
MKSDDVLLAAWQETLARRGDLPAIFDTRGAVARTFREIDARAREIEARMEQLAPGQVYPIQIGNDPDWPSMLLACLRRRLVALPLDDSITGEQRKTALQVCRVRCLEDWGAHPPSLLKLTSGTTAEPRAIRFRSGQLLADCTQICEAMGITDRDLNFAVIPLSHSYGFSNLVTPLLVRGVPMVLSRDPMPRAVLDDLARTNATVFAGMPVFYQAFSEMNEVPVLAQLRLCISAGAPLPLAVAKKFRAKFERSIHSFYGASECGGICYDRDARLLEDNFVGQAMGGVELELVEPDAVTSCVRVRSTAVGDGYFPEPDKVKLGGGRFMPDDLLTRGSDGLRLVGRVSDLINVAGKKVNPAEVEAELMRFPGVSAAVVFGRESSLRNEDVAACIVGCAQVREAELLEFCRHRLSGWQVPKRIFLVAEIPVNARGKVSRRELAQKFVL